MSFVDSSVSASTQYWYRVVASNSAGPGLPSDSVSASTPAVSMALLSNGFEGGSDGTALTAASSGGQSGNPFNTVSCGSGTAVYSSAAAAHGAVSAVFSPQNGSCYLAWTAKSVPTVAEGYGRGYVRFSADPAATTALVKVMGPSGQRDVQVNVSKSGMLSLLDATGVTRATFSQPIPLGQWVRLEWHEVAASAGSFELRMYAADSTVALDSRTISAVNTGSAVGGVQFGALSSIAGGYGATIGLDDIGYGTTGWLGPSQ
jgi:hypothetical protein